MTFGNRNESLSLFLLVPLFFEGGSLFRSFLLFLSLLSLPFAALWIFPIKKNQWQDHGSGTLDKFLRRSVPALRVRV
ncbi:hypothetical protein BDV39DRAFT_185474, partial [Aspergillus sergii]